MIDQLRASSVNRLIIHSILQKEAGSIHSECLPDDELTIADNAILNIIKSRVSQSCGKQSKSFKLTIAHQKENSFFSYASSIMETADDDGAEDIFIMISQSIASLLAESQTRLKIPGGLLLVMQGIFPNGSKYVVVIKAELQEALITVTNPDNNQKRLELLKEIFLSSDEKFYKIGLIFQTELGTFSDVNDGYDCYLYDDQFSPGKIPAEYFFKDFLGFSIDQNEKYLSKQFYDKSISVIKSSRLDTNTKKECLLALRAVMHDQTGIINPTEFRDRFLPLSIHRDYTRVVIESQPAFGRSFPRNLSLFGNEFKNRKMTFRNMVVIQGPESSFDENVQIIETVEAATKVIEEEPNATLLRINGKPFENIGNARQRNTITE